MARLPARSNYMARKKKTRQSKQKRNAILPPRLMERLHQVDRLMFAGHLNQARDKLDELDRLHPGQPEILLRLTNVCHDLKDYAAFQAACEQLVAIKPSAAYTLMLAGSYLANTLPVLALRTFRLFLERWPDHPRAGEARETAGELQTRLDDFLAGIGLTGPGALELAGLHEEVQALLGQGKYPEARQKAEEVLRRRPDFPPALNNIAQTYFAEGALDKSIATSRRVLAIDSENIHALSNLTRDLYLSGRGDEARACAERLKAAPPVGFDVWTKKAEALIYLGDDEALADLLRDFQVAAGAEEGPASPLFLHLVAVAALRLGREKEARRHWSLALRRQPGLASARANLDDLRKPVGERHAPWPFTLNHWVPKKLLDGMIAYHMQAESAKTEHPADEQAAGFLRAHPEFNAVVPALFDRGDPAGREFALRTAMLFKTPEMLSALRDFALGQRGPDAMRGEAAQAALQAGLLPSGPIRMWVRGKWQELHLFGWEITTEPFHSHQHSEQVQELLAEGSDALHQGEPARAEELYKRALELEPDAPDVLNNLAAAYEAMNRHTDAMTLLRQIHERFPDYLFARAAMAKVLIADGRLDEAKALLDPLLSRKRLHTSEFSVLASAQIDYLLAQKQKDGARSWFEMWQKAVPDAPLLRAYRLKFRFPRWRTALSSWRR
jgi:tetratricopeptide (TPR) repeat protein